MPYKSITTQYHHIRRSRDSNPLTRDFEFTNHKRVNDRSYTGRRPAFMFEIIHPLHALNKNNSIENASTNLITRGSNYQFYQLDISDLHLCIS